MVAWFSICRWLRGTARRIASPRCAWSVTGRGRRWGARLDLEGGRWQHNRHSELCRRRLHPRRYGAAGAAGGSSARRAAATPEKLRRGQPPAAIEKYSRDPAAGLLSLARKMGCSIDPLKGEARDEKAVWRGVRGWALPGHAPSFRPVDKAPAEQTPR